MPVQIIKVIRPGLYPFGIKLKQPLQGVVVLGGLYLCPFATSCIRVTTQIGFLNIDADARFLFWDRYRWRVTERAGQLQLKPKVITMPGHNLAPGDIITLTTEDKRWWRQAICRLLRRPTPQREVRHLITEVTDSTMTVKPHPSR